MVMALEKRVERIEQALTPGAVMVCLSKYSCESDEVVRQRAVQALGRPFTDGDIQLTIVREWLGCVCPTGQHSHPEDAQIWPHAS